jgi:replicative DNA helicase
MIEKGYLYNIIKVCDFKLINKTNPEWFLDKINKELFISCFKTFSENKTLTYETLRAYIHEADYNQQMRAQVLNRLEDIKKITSNPLVQPVIQLQEEYQEHYIKNLAFELNHAGNTTEFKIKQAQDIIKKINENSRIDNLHNYNDLANKYMASLINGEVDKFKERSIKIENQIYKNIFGKFIHPWPIVIASRTGNCKTIVLLNIVFEMLCYGKSGIYICTEDNKETFRNKLFSLQNNVDFTIVKNGELSKDEAAKYNFDILNNKLWIYDGRLGLHNVKTFIDRQFAIRNFDFICIDYLGGLSTMKGQKRHEAIADFMSDMVNLCHEYYCPVFIVSQTNDRDEKKSGTIELDLGDLKDSSSIEEQARQVILIEGNREENDRIIKMAKNTGAGLFKKNAKFNWKYLKMTSCEDI